MDKEKKIYIVMALIAVLGLVGFISVFNQLSFLGGKVGLLNSEITSFQSVARNMAPQNGGQISPGSSGSSGAPSSSINQGGGVASSAPTSAAAVSGANGIPASIVFYATSTLNSQSPAQIMLTIENVAKVGSQLTIDFKVYNQSQENGAIDPSSLIGLFDLSSGSLTKGSVNGNFSLITPQNSVNGSLTFLIDPSQNSAILQTGSPDNPVFYKFDFLSGSYQETVVG